MPGRTSRQIEYDLKAGRLLHRGGRSTEAEQVYRAALAEGHMSLLLALLLAELLKETGRAAEAVDWYERAIALSPADARLYDELADLLVSLERQAEADEVLARGLAAAPDLPAHLAAEGRRLAAAGRAEAAARALRRAVAAAPGDAELRNDLGCVLLRLGAPEAAEAQFREGLAARPLPAALQAMICNNLAGLARLQGRAEEAERLYREAVAAAPDYADGWGNLGGLLREGGRMAEARDALRRALSLRSPWPERHSNLIFCLDFDPEAGLREQAEERARFRQAVEAPLAGRRYRHSASPDPEKRLRIGYVSGDFKEHSAALGFGAVLLNHDLGRFDILLYSSGRQEDARTAEFMAAATAFRRVAALSDAELAAQVRRDGIDILVDLSGHSPPNRLPVFARRPAPVQASAWGYATGTGLATMDYLLVDHRLVPERLRGHFSEAIVELPCFLSYRPRMALPKPVPPPVLQAGKVTFGSLNRLAKASGACLAVWARLLRRVPGSRLLLKCRTLDDPRVRARTAAAFAAEGIGAERLELRGGSHMQAHLQSYAEIDIALDPFPYCGGITTAEALLLGVPVVSLCGEVPVSRNGYALLGAIGFEEWVAHNPADYIATAAALAAAPQRLAALRDLLPRIVRASPLGDNAGYARAVESAYRRLWLRHCLAARAGG